MQAFASVAVTVKANGPDAVGVPDSTPVALSSSSPAGSVPVVTLHAIGVRPAGLREGHRPIGQRHRAARDRGRRDGDGGAGRGRERDRRIRRRRIGRIVRVGVRDLGSRRRSACSSTPAAGRSSGSSVKVVAGDAVRFVSVTAVAPHVSVKAPAPALTGSLNVTLRLASTATFVAPVAGVVAVTVGAASPTGMSGTLAALALPAAQNWPPGEVYDDTSTTRGTAGELARLSIATLNR